MQLGRPGVSREKIADDFNPRSHDFLLPQSTIRTALDLFEKSEADVLPVLADAQSRKIVGKLSEAHALREYGRELEKRNREFTDR